MNIKSGSPTAIVKILTENRKFGFTTQIGDPNSDILSITTNKDLNSPAGTFEIQFVPKLDSDGKSWADKLSPHDYVEIGFVGISDTQKVVTMRGLIETVSKSENWEAGTPRRQITVSGRDLGAMFQQFEVFYIPELSPVKAILSKIMPWDENNPLVLNAQGAFTYVMKKFEDYIDIQVGDESLLKHFSYAAQTMFPDDQTSLFYLFGYEGDFWNAFSRYQDKPFHEMFVYDPPGEDKSWFIMRPSRLKDSLGVFQKRVTEIENSSFTTSTVNVNVSYENPEVRTISGNIFYPPGFKIGSVDKISIDVTKNMNEIFNYYFTIPEAPQLFKVVMRSQCVSPYRDNPQDCENPFFQMDASLPAFIGKYGFKKYEATTVYLDLDVGKLERKDRHIPLDKLVRMTVIEKAVQRNRTLVAWFLHNEYLLSGTIAIPGTNKAIIGTYVEDEDDSLEYYVEGVTHNFVLFQSFTTSLRVTRGMPPANQGGLGYRNKYFFGGEGNVYAPVMIPVGDELLSCHYPTTDAGQLVPSHASTKVLSDLAVSHNQNYDQKRYTDSLTATRLGIKNDNPPESAVQSLKALDANVTQPLEKALNSKVNITSGWRSDELNSVPSIGGADNSDHKAGKAMDVQCGASTEANADKIIKAVKDNGIPYDQMIKENKGSKYWVHISYNSAGNRGQNFSKSI